MVYKVWINLINSKHTIETIETKNKVSAHHEAYEKYKDMYVASVILEG